MKPEKYPFFPAGALLQLCGPVRDAGTVFLTSSGHAAHGIAVPLAPDNDFPSFFVTALISDL